MTQEEPPRLRRLDPAIPRDLETIVHKAIEKDPAQRYATAQELAEDLRRFLEDRPIRARRVPAAERLARWARRNKGLAASLAAVGLLLVTSPSDRRSPRCGIRRWPNGKPAPPGSQGAS